MKGIILVGGEGKRLFPLTASINKHLLPIYNKPMIYYSLSVLFLAKIKDIMIISSKRDIKNFKLLLGTGSDFGVKFNYAIQDKPNGIPEAFKIGRKFIKKDNVCLVLGDNIFYGQYFLQSLLKAKNLKEGATVFTYKVSNPSDFAVIEFNKNKKISKIEEKPDNPKSNNVLTGLYFFDHTVTKKINNISKSSRGEFEITDILNKYLNEKKLKTIFLGRGFAWLDTGSFDNLSLASEFVKTIEHQQGLMISCIEEISYRNNWISKKKLISLAFKYKNSNYGDYLIKIANEKH
tara:strand:+ start:353 stop:1225 length:873 start_codon:yes stop_codon:yes gene_type:complete